MSHDIIDNRSEILVDHIRDILPTTEACKFAVGYFFLSGLQAVADVLDSVGELRLLIGNTTNRQTIEQIAEGYRRLEQVQQAAEGLAYPKRADMAQWAEETADNISQAAALMDQTDDAEALVSALARLIEEGRLHVRVYAKGRLHAKAYIFDYGPIYNAAGALVPREERGIAVVGSSNLSLSGVTSNTELNVVVHGNANHAALTEWFEALWDEALPFEQQLMDELRRSWSLAQVTPYEIYLKTLYELTRETVEGEEDEFLWPGDIQAVLTNFQERAVRQTIRTVRRYGGAFVSDVVGLGKSYIGAAVVKHFEQHDRARPLIICPASLVEMWEHYNEAYHLNARVLSTGMLREDDQHGPEWMLHDERYRYRDFVLIDESHNFRHTDTQRYRVLQSYLAADDRRCLLLTATPRNKTAWDIYHQIRLFHQRDVTELPIDPPHLRRFFDLAEEGRRRLPELLSLLLIRRTRNHILRWYGFDAETDERVDPDRFEPYLRGQRRAYVLVGGRQQFFPKRQLATIEYSIEDTYSGLYQRLRRYMGMAHPPDAPTPTDEMTYARYGLWHYVRNEKRRRAPYAEMQRAGANLRGLMRIMLFKRFESSVHAFRQTVRRMLRTHRLFLAALERGIVPAGEEAQSILYESDIEEEQALLDALEQVSGRYDAADFYLDALKRDIGQDIAVLQSMLDLVEPITPDGDDKLQTLRQWLARDPLNVGKRLIFTQFSDTAQYLYDNLDAGQGRPDIEVVYSSSTNKAPIVGRFAPIANPEHRPPPGTPEIDTLISTDVLAEGLNLQDCDKLINYDLHWNPVRLIQRMGRIDRIGSEHDTIYAFNFMPETGLDENLSLRETLRYRIREIHETIGEDAAILDPTEQVNEEAMYAIYTEGDIGEYESSDVDDYVDLHEAEEIIRQLRENEPELYEHIANLRDGIRSGCACDEPTTYLFCQAGRYRQLFLADEQGEVITREVPRILQWLKCEPDTPAEPLPNGYNERVMAIKQLFDREVEARRAEMQHTVSLTRAQQYVRRELRTFYKEVEDPDLRRQIEVFDTTFSAPSPRPAVGKELNRLQRSGLKGMSLLERLSSIYAQHNLGARRDRDTSAIQDENDGLPRIVCSEAGVAGGPQ